MSFAWYAAPVSGPAASPGRKRFSRFHVQIRTMATTPSGHLVSTPPRNRSTRRGPTRAAGRRSGRASRGRGCSRARPRARRRERLEGRQLGVEQGHRHEVALAGAHAGRQLLARPDQVHEPHVRDGVAEQVPVGAAQRGARHDRPVRVRGELEARRAGATATGRRRRAACRRPSSRGSPAGWRLSASRNGTPSRSASSAPTVDLPQPETPMTTTWRHQSCTVPSASRLYGRYATS